WTGRDTGDKAPEIAPEHWDRISPMIRLKNDSFEQTLKPGAENAGISGKNNMKARDENGEPIVKRKAGQFGSFMLANNKFNSMQEYHKIHDSFLDLVNRHGADASSAVNELMQHKVEGGKPKYKQTGYTAGPVVRGFKPKVARYTYGMLGGGNVVVPDTHFTRYLFGLEKGAGAKNIDNNTIELIRNQLWNERNSHIMEGIDKYYAEHHPAVKHMQEHPVYGQHFQGADAQHAIFPAFWKNWIAIVPHEAARGYKTGGVNEYTDHRPYWEAIDPFLKKSEDDYEMSLPMRTAMLHNEWVNRYGEL